MAPLYRGETMDADWHEDTMLLWIGVRSSPSQTEIDKACTVLGTWVTHTTARFAVHIEHVADTHLAPPELPVLLSIASRLLEYRDVLDTKLRGTCIQAQKLDEAARFARDLFLSVYQPHAPLHIVEGASAARKALAEVRCV